MKLSSGNMRKPEVHGPLNVAQEKNKKMTREQMAKHIENMRARDSELVSGIFKNLENPASGSSRGSVAFAYKLYPGDQEFYELTDGERYTLPRGVARHLNVNCFYREYQHLPGEFGQTGMRGAAPDGRLHTTNMQMSRKVHRFAFHSLEYMDDDGDMTPTNLVEVTMSN
jgi:hypothetical protein